MNNLIEVLHAHSIMSLAVRTALKHGCTDHLVMPPIIYWLVSNLIHLGLSFTPRTLHSRSRFGAQQYRVSTSWDQNVFFKMNETCTCETCTCPWERVNHLQQSLCVQIHFWDC